ncbi:hypothetical protein DFQ11_10827 [Winogradskyella epiphytica]|uniref:Uncharacterized protein n=1 Tax=Winogradskyella epiphytica TaxID=262005 RepID=A0A2V4YAH4_9FLAO|nr:hypothetical protein [Winogradskyella epiphytica]PYE80003.1 hypothetical protein DFQ11_10827 [Winogradskyella epiphytica]GGW73090.1 hypothetical protein GCM10008085_26640 [Winogradskyella epiphytica]
MKTNKVISGCISLIIGCIILLLIIDFMSKPDNASIALKPIESMDTYFFSFVYTMGNMGWALASILLIAYFGLCYAFGSWLYGKIVGPIEED